MTQYLGKKKCETLRVYFLFLPSSVCAFVLILMARIERDQGFPFHVFSMLQHH